jgi:hypothetical protein
MILSYSSVYSVLIPPDSRTALNALKGRGPLGTSAPHLLPYPALAVMAWRAIQRGVCARIWGAFVRGELLVGELLRTDPSSLLRKGNW